MTHPQAPSPIETVREVYAAFARGDVPAILARMGEDVDWEPGYAHNADIPWLAPGRGRSHVAGFLQALAAFEFRKFDVFAIMTDGPWVVALVAVELFHRSSGRSLSEPCEAHIWKLAPSGKVLSMRHAADTRAHARVAGV
jgi:ketosteroid isomerase-like protein